MEFIEATLNPNFLPKRALKEVCERSPKSEGKANKKTEKSRKRAALHGRAGTHGLPCTDARPPVHRRTGGCALMHGRAPTHGRASGARLSVRLCARLDVLLAEVRPCTLRFSSVLLFPVLGTSLNL